MWQDLQRDGRHDKRREGRRLEQSMGQSRPVNAAAAARARLPWRAGRRRTLHVLSALAIATSVVEQAAAYCRTHACEFSPAKRALSFDSETPPAELSCEPDPDGCSTVGPAALWPSACVSYVVERNGSLKEDISSEALSRVVAAGFKTWSQAKCGIDTPRLTATDRGLSACTELEFNCASEQNVNLIVFRDEAAGIDPSEIASTRITANWVTGEIVDADIEINSYNYRFALPRESKPNALDLQAVLTHEIGHFLGLAHSDDPRALMSAHYPAQDAGLRADDVAAICAHLQPGPTDPMCSRVLSLTEEAQCIGSEAADCNAHTSVVQLREGGCSLPGVPSEPRHAGLLAGGWLLAAAMRRWRTVRR
jgi:hypothetical protein